MPQRSQLKPNLTIPGLFLFLWVSFNIFLGFFFWNIPSHQLFLWGGVQGQVKHVDWATCKPYGPRSLVGTCLVPIPPSSWNDAIKGILATMMQEGVTHTHYTIHIWYLTPCGLVYKYFSNGHSIVGVSPVQQGRYNCCCRCYHVVTTLYLHINVQCVYWQQWGNCVLAAVHTQTQTSFVRCYVCASSHCKAVYKNNAYMYIMLNCGLYTCTCVTLLYREEAPWS